MAAVRAADRAARPLRIAPTPAMAVPAADTMRQIVVTGLALDPGPVDRRCQLECSGTKKTVAAASTTQTISQRCAVVRNRAARSLVTPRTIQLRPAAPR